MATKPADIVGLRDKLRDELQGTYKKLEAAKQKVRDNPGEGRKALEALKREYAEKGNEFAEIARAAATLAGGQNYQPPPPPIGTA